MYNSCQNEFGGPWPSKNGGSFTKSGEHWGWWRNETCFMETNKGYVYNVLISIGFLTADYFQLGKIENPSTIQNQTKIHHIMAVSGYGLSIFAGYGYPGVSNASLVCEISSIFLHFKDMFTKETRNSALAQIN